MYDISIIVRAIIVRNSRVIIMTEIRCCQVSRDVVGICGAYQIYGRRQLGNITVIIGQKIINVIFVILRHIVLSEHIGGGECGMVT